MSENDRLVDPATITVTDAEPSSGISNADGATVEPERRLEPSIDMPVELQGKELPEIVERFRNKESERGRLAKEVGDLRKRIREYEAATQQPQQQEANPDYWDDPLKAIDSRLEPIQSQMNELRADRLRAELTSTHPDWQDTISKPEFQEWVKERESRVLLATSGDAGNVNAARELLDSYKEALDSGNATPAEAVRRDRLDRAASPERGTSRRPMGKVWTNTEIQNLKIYQPRVYDEKLPEIRRAYAENRVRNE